MRELGRLGGGLIGVSVLSAKSGNFGAERVPERSQGSPMVQMKAESKTFNMAYHKIWICILGYD